MGYIAVQESTNPTKSTRLIGGKVLKEATDINYFFKPTKELVKLFKFVDICDNGKIILTNGYKKDFAVFE